MMRRCRRAWAQFCDRLKSAGRAGVQGPQRDVGTAARRRLPVSSPRTSARRSIWHWKPRTPRYPAIHAFCNPTRKLGGDCADFTYQQAWIDGDSTYRITGDRGTARFLNITVQGPRPDGPGVLHEPFGDVPEANLLRHIRSPTRPTAASRSTSAGDERETNWLPTTAGSRKLFIRQGFDGWEERPARLRIERVDMDSPKPVPTPDTMIEAMNWAADFVTGLMDDWPEYPVHATAGWMPSSPNRFPEVASTGDDAKRGRAASNMYWELAPDEALIIEFDAHAGLWTLTNMGAFFTSMDYLYRPVSYTPSRASVDGDGKVRLILAHRDPGYHNWMDTQGFERGNVTYRHMLEGEPVPLSTTVVKHADLANALPPDTATVTEAERTTAMWLRFNGIRLRYGH